LRSETWRRAPSRSRAAPRVFADHEQKSGAWQERHRRACRLRGADVLDHSGGIVVSADRALAQERWEANQGKAPQLGLARRRKSPSTARSRRPDQKFTSPKCPSASLVGRRFAAPSRGRAAEPRLTGRASTGDPPSAVSGKGELEPIFGLEGQRMAEQSQQPRGSRCDWSLRSIARCTAGDQAPSVASVAAWAARPPSPRSSTPPAAHPRAALDATASLWRHRGSRRGGGSGSSSRTCRRASARRLIAVLRIRPRNTYMRIRTRRHQSGRRGVEPLLGIRIALSCQLLLCLRA
jgi:hypothetical protein